MSSLPTIVVDKLQCFLDFLIPSAMVLKIRLEFLEFGIWSKSKIGRRIRIKSETRSRISKIKGENRAYKRKIIKFKH
jgi:hypothetical protein